MAVINIYATNDGAVHNSGSDWDTVHDAASGTDHSHTRTAATVFEHSASFGITRGFYTFDTSTLPANILITGIKLFLYVNYKSGSTENNYCDCRPYNCSDYGVLGNDSYNEGGITPLSDVFFNFLNYSNVEEYNGLPLNKTALGYINKSGNTFICLRNSFYDVADGSPPWDSTDEKGIRTAASTNSDKPPYLEITYIPLKPNFFNFI
jgi:hypothetical protein